MDEELAQALAAKRLRQRAKDYLEELKEEFHETLPGNHSPAETILLAYLMTITDGYNRVEYRSNSWERRRKSGWGTTLGYLVDIGPVMVPFAFESRHDSNSRLLAILLDENEPGVRTARKNRQEATLVSLGASVLLFSSNEVFADPDGCAARVEATLSKMTDAVLSDAGVIRGNE